MDALDRGEVVTLFPEGTRSRDGELQEPQRGAGLIWKKAGVPVIPVYIEGSYEIFPPGAKFPRPGKVVIHVGAALELPPDFALACSGADPYHHLANLIMRRIRARRVAG
jgi:1-acyl-sn-glycerol-3-phosphate acyltransferase